MSRFFWIPLFLLLSINACGTTSSSGPAVSGEAVSQKKGGKLWQYKRKFFNLYSEKTDVRIGEHYMELQIKEFQKKKKGVDEPQYADLKNRVEKIVQKIAAVSDKPNLPYEVHIFSEPEIANAFCLPGGKIGIFTGLFTSEKAFVDINSDDQIAAVIGHEVAHATLRHVTRRLTTYQGINIFGTAASIGLGEGIGANAQDIFERVFSFGLNLYIPSYSRKHEKEADRAGFYYMSKAGFDPRAAIAIWRKAADKGGPNSKNTDFFASHPASGERAKTLEGWLDDALTLREN